MTHANKDRALHNQGRMSGFPSTLPDTPRKPPAKSAARPAQCSASLSNSALRLASARRPPQTGRLLRAFERSALEQNMNIRATTASPCPPRARGMTGRSLDPILSRRR